MGIGSNHVASHCDQYCRSEIGFSYQHLHMRATIGVLSWLCLVSAATAQPNYTFTSGPSGDGFDWPVSPTGLLPDDFFETPDGVEFDNFIGNNLFFDSQYQVVGNAPGITNDAMWGNPIDNGFGSLEIYFLNFETPQTVAFDFAWSVAGSPDATPLFVDIYMEDSDGRAIIESFFLGNTFTGLGGVDGYADRINIDAADFFDDLSNVDDGPFIDIAYISIFIIDIAGGGSSSEFGIDNFDIDSVGTGLDELFPSINQGAIDATGVIQSHSVLRGIGTFTTGLEVTNSSLNDTTFSTQLVPGGGLSDAGQAIDEPILAGQTIYLGTLASIDRSLPSNTYDSDIVVINTGNLSDPDNTTTIRVRLLESPSLTAPSPVNISGGEKVHLSNAPPPANGHRASVKVTGTTTTGPFDVSGYDVNTAIKPGETVMGDVNFDRFGHLSGNYDGTFIASLKMANFVGTNNDIETFLFNADPVSDVQWLLNAALADTPADNAAYALGDNLGVGLVGTNSTFTAATLLGGTATESGNVSMSQGFSPIDSSTDVIGEAVEVGFTTAVPVYVVQMTYRDVDLCVEITETNLSLLYFNSSAANWQLAVNGNSDNGASATFFAGIFQDFAATLGGAPLSSALGTYGLDTTSNQVWAVVDHAATFGTGELGTTCRMLADLDNDGDVDLDDYSILSSCIGGPSTTTTPACTIADLDSNGDVDLADHAIFTRAFTGM